MANNAFGIDLGTNNIKIYNRNDDNIMIEKNMIAIENKNTLFAYGNSAFEMYEKAPSNIHISYPLSNGVIADIKNMETLVKYFIGDLQKGNTKPSDFFIAVPTDVTEVEKRAFYDLIKGANVKAKKIMVVEKAVKMAEKMDVPIVGVVENMSYVACPDCGKKIYLFGQGKSEEAAKRHNLPLLAQMPIDPKLAALVDAGKIEEFEGTWLNAAADALEKTRKRAE